MLPPSRERLVGAIALALLIVGGFWLVWLNTPPARPHAQLNSQFVTSDERKSQVRQTIPTLKRAPQGPTTCAHTFLGICFEPADIGTAPPIFGFAQFISTLALLVVVFNVSDFRYRFRLLLTRYPVRPIAFAVSASIAALILLIDVWFHNAWLIPSALNSHNNLRAFLGAVFLSMVFYLIFIAFVRPPRFGRTNAYQYFRAMYDFVGRGNPDQLVAIAQELGASGDRIVKCAAEYRPEEANQQKRRSCQECAHYILLLLGDRRLCHAMVDKAPWTAARFFQCAGESQRVLPLSQFARNISGELVFNPRSALHNEDDGFSSGFMGYTKPVTKAVYGNFQLVDALASNHGSPLDLELDLRWEMKAEHLEAYARASLIFCESYFASDHPTHHSYAFYRMLDQFKSSTRDVHRLNGASDDASWRMDEYQRLNVTIRFIRDLVALIEKHEVPYYGPLKTKERPFDGVYNQVANLVFEVVFNAACVSEPTWTCWSVQHNAVWSELFHNERNRTWKIIRFKLRRLLYNEIKRMDKGGNFKGARILGFCLNVLGFHEKRTRDYDRDEVALRIVVVAWTKRNYLRLVEDHPKVAKACLHGSIVYDAGNQQLVKTYADETRKEPNRSFLKLVVPTRFGGCESASA